MFIPKCFEQHDQAHIQEFIKSHPLATLIFNIDGVMEAHHIPLLFCNNRLIGHVALANDIWKKDNLNENVLAIFQGSDHFISASWYISKQNNGKVVPTWNYEAVHINGNISFVTDDNEKRQILTSLTASFESIYDTKPWSMKDAPDTFINKMLNAVVAFNIDIKDISAKSKLSQNQTKENQQSVKEALSSLDNEKANEMMCKINSNKAN